MVVFLDRGLEQIDLALSERGLVRHYRVGVAQRGYDDPLAVHRVDAVSGIGLRPYSPVHLRTLRDGTGDLSLSWIRRTRIDGDSWVSVEVPLGEEEEEYLVSVHVAAGRVRQERVSSCSWMYTRSQQVSDGASETFYIDVSQLSRQFGAGPPSRCAVRG